MGETCGQSLKKGAHKGEPCAKPAGHKKAHASAEKWAAELAAMRDRAAVWRADQDNLERKRAYDRQYAKDNIDAMRERKRHWRDDNRHWNRTYHRAYYWTNPDRARERSRDAQRRHRTRLAAGQVYRRRVRQTGQGHMLEVLREYTALVKNTEARIPVKDSKRVGQYGNRRGVRR